MKLLCWICGIIQAFPIITAMAIFVPSSEWQFVPEDVAIPGGLEIRMDLENGGRWARLLPGKNAEEQQVVVASPEHNLNSLDLVTVSLDSSQLNAMEEKAHDYDDGADIARLHGLSLYELFKNSQNTDHDQAGRILGICIRNNKDASRALVTVCPELWKALKFDRRSLSIVSSLTTTTEGLRYLQSHDTINFVRRNMTIADQIDSSTSKAIVKLLQDLAIADENSEDMCRWVDSLQQAFYNTQNADLKQVALDIVQHTGNFESLKIHCTPQPGLLPEHEDRKRAIQSARRFENPMASRNHFDEL